MVGHELFLTFFSSRIHYVNRRTERRELGENGRKKGSENVFIIIMNNYKRFVEK